MALYYGTNLGLDFTRLSANGLSGGAGTVFIKSTTQSFGELVLSGGNASVAASPIPLEPAAILYLDVLSIKNNARGTTPNTVQASSVLRDASNVSFTSPNLNIP